MTSVLLTGGTGFIGGHLRLALRDQPVVLLGRSKPNLYRNERWANTNLAHAVPRETLEGSEVLCHLAYSMSSGRSNLNYNRHLIDAVNRCPDVRHVVLMSSTSVYGSTTSAVVDEASPCTPVGEYAETKLACELAWREELRDNCALTVLRPSTVIGPNSVGLLSMIQDALRRPILGPVKRSVLYHRSVHYVAVTNVIAAVLFSMHRERATMREIYVVADDHYPENKSYAAMQDAVRISAGQRPWPGIALPHRVLPLLGSLTNRPTLGLKRVFSSEKIHGAGFGDATTLYDEVKRTVASFERYTV
ncbi:NAD-dependent epimerase/dehydratase family protein [Rubrobacter marinus]|nr:NAD-dependent epimerase/dehydratase family protein [Rubrobacter marinus]